MLNTKSKIIQEHINTFHNLMIDILRRRAIFRVFEKNLIGKDNEDVVYGNEFVSSYITDYTRGQLIDFRKFFETDDSSYKIPVLLEYIGNVELKKEHKKLFKEWKEKFEDQVNKVIVHLDKDSVDILKTVNKKDVDNFIDRTNQFLDDIVKGLKTKGSIQLKEELRDLNGDLLNKEPEIAFKKYLEWSCNSKPVDNNS